MNIYEIIACHKDNEEAFKQLEESIKKNNVVPFIGAGLSTCQYPSWSKLLKDMASDYGIEDEIETILNLGQYEEAASRLEDEMTAFDFLRELENKFDPRELEEVELPEIFNHITSLWRGNVVTTNFDRILEKAYRNAEIDLDAITPYDVFNKRVEAAIQGSKNLIIKLHGDVKDKDNMVLTKETYDKYYGEKEVDKTLVMPKALERILQARQLLFLGCSLQQDRTMEVIRVVNNSTHFAIVSLPEETKNADNPMKPKLKDDKGVIYSTYKERLKQLANHNIIRIWYPYGEHKAVEVILRELAEKFGKKQINDQKYENKQNDFRYVHLHELIGRDEKVNEIVADMRSSKGGKVFVVSGPPGIGKTEVCRGVHKKLKEEFDTLDMPYVDCTGVTIMDAFYYKLAEELRVSRPEVVTKDQLLKLLSEHIDMRTKQGKFIFYFDNWEDVWYGVRDTVEKKELNSFMQILKANKCDTLLSTREYPDGWEKKPYTLEPLDNDSAKQLFLSIYSPTQNSQDEASLNELLKELEGYPLALVLVASQASKMPSLKMLLNKWHEAKAETGRESHSSMDVAVRMSWNAIAYLESAKHIWGILSLVHADLTHEFLEEIMNPPFEKGWITGLTALKDANLVFYRDEKIAMLSPLKNLCYKLQETAEKELEEECLLELGEALLKRIKNKNNNEIDYYTRLHAFMEVYDEILNVTELLIELDSNETRTLLHELVKYMCISYSISYKSIHVVEKLCQYYKENNRIRAYLLISCGDLQERLGKLEKAEQYFLEAESIYISEQDKLGIAKVLIRRGYLQRHLGKLEKSEKSFTKAELLLRNERDDLGLAGLFEKRGNLHIFYNELEKAEQSFSRAEEIYRSEKNNLGLADITECRGYLQQRLGKMEIAEQSYLEAEALYRIENDNLGLAKVLIGLGRVQSQLGKSQSAEEKYLEAESLYKSEKFELGVASVYRNIAHLYKTNGDNEKALEFFEKAKLLYESEKSAESVENTKVLINIIHEQMKLASKDAE